MLIRADASPQIGTGHIMRSLALAQAAHDRDIPVHFICRAAVDWVRARLKVIGITFSELADPVPEKERPEDLLAQLGADKKASWAVLDGYHFGLDCQQAVRAAGYKLLVIDDYAHLPEYSCDILLNQNIGAEELAYKGDIGQKLLGPQYALLRPEFTAARRSAEERRLPEKVQNILLTLGGGDFSEHLALIAPSFVIPELAGCTLRVIAGTVPQEHIRVLLRDCPAKLEILDRVDDMPALLLDTDLCVTAGGSTCWELCCLGVPFLTVEVAENQHRIAEELAKRGIAPALEVESFALMCGSDATRHAVRQRGLELVDGHGSLVCLSAIEGRSFFVRRACPADSDFVWRLAAEPEVRALSCNTAPIAWPEHQAWFATRLREAQPFFIPCGRDTNRLGYVRFSAKDNATSNVSIALMKEHRGKGLGGNILEAACREFWKSFPGVALDALVLPDNTASQKIFLTAGFTQTGTILAGGREFMLLSTQERE